MGVTLDHTHRQHEAGDDVDPEHWHIVDKQTDEEIAWSAVEVVSE